MALPSSAPISMTQVQDEFGAPRGTDLNSFHRGGGRVPNSAQNGNVPASGSIDLLDFLGTANYTPMVVSAPNATGDSGTGTTNNVFASSTASVSGGQAPFSYAWAQVSGSAFTINNPTSATTSFTRAGKPPNPSPASGTYRCTVTDATSATAFKDITVTDNRS